MLFRWAAVLALSRCGTEEIQDLGKKKKTELLESGLRWGCIWAREGEERGGEFIFNLTQLTRLNRG